MALENQSRITVTLRALVFTLLSAGGYVAISYFTNRVWFYQFIGLYAGLFVLYFAFVQWYLTRQETLTIRHIQVIGVLLRLSVFFLIPNLSDDFFRFYWDGKLLFHGYNPYLILPKDFVGTPEALQHGFDQALYESLAGISQVHYTLYPPFNQALFATAAGLFPHDLFGGALVMRFWILLADIGIIWLIPQILKALGRSSKGVAWYALNPYLVLELTANLHFEGVMIFMLLLAFYWLIKGGYLLTGAHQGSTHYLLPIRVRLFEITLPDPATVKPKYLILSAVAFTLAVNTKLIPLIFLPPLLLFLGWKRSIIYYGIVIGLTAFLFSFFITPDFITKFQDSFNLYFQKFEFNASVYYVLRWIGYQTHGYNLIAVFGVALSIVSTLGALVIALYPTRKAQAKHLVLKMVFILTFYYSMATIVHPWYISVILTLAIFTPYRFPMVWSAMLGLTYYAYSTNPYHENLYLVAVEYLVVVGWLIWELFKVARRPNKVGLSEK